MSKNDLIALLASVICDLRADEKMRGEDFLHSIIDDYQKVIDLLVADDLSVNIIRTSPRQYLEIYSDYESPMLEKMDRAQYEVQAFIGVHP